MFGRSAVRGKREADSANSERPLNNEKCCLIKASLKSKTGVGISENFPGTQLPKFARYPVSSGTQFFRFSRYPVP